MPGSSSWRDLRGRGGAWAISQFVVMAAIAGAWLLPPHWPDAVAGPLKVVGIAIAIMGTALALWSYRTLGKSMTPLPEPRAGGALVARGPYRLARHPMYGGGLVLFAGVSLATSIPALVLTLGLAILWWRKTIEEERRLSSRYEGYDAYRSATRRRFLPYLA
jgi:protein-S-isoprenylcysteine O-methyltransferase Ste14